MYVIFTLNFHACTIINNKEGDSCHILPSKAKKCAKFCSIHNNFIFLYRRLETDDNIEESD